MEEKEKKHLVAIIILVGVIAVVGIAALFYMQKYKYYTEHFYTGTMLNGVDCSDLTVEETKAIFQADIDEYTFTLTDQEGRTYTLSGPDIEMKYSGDGSVEEFMKEQDPILWIFNMKNPVSGDVKLAYTYSSDAISNWLSSLECITDGVAPTDAYKEKQEDGYWHIVAENYGSELDFDKVLELVDTAVEKGETQLSLADQDCYVKPAVLSDDEALNEEVKAANKQIDYEKKVDALTNINISLVIGTDEKNTSVLNQKLLKPMLVEDEDGNPQIDMEQVKSWVETWATNNNLLNDDYLFVTYSGELVHLDAGTDTGWRIDVDKTAQAVCDAVEAGKDATVKAVLSRSDTGTLLSEETYVEIIIPEQRMICYVNGEVKVDTPIVSGSVYTNLSYDTYTPSNGIWHIFYKTQNYTMHGPMQSDGTYEYVTYVDYWMPFNGDVGIHDMQSRGEFGGTIYLNNGSHGCINTPYDAAKEIYSYVSVGTKVVVWGDNGS